MRTPRFAHMSPSNVGRTVLVGAVTLVWLAVAVQLYRGLWGGEEVVVHSRSDERPAESTRELAPRPFLGEFPDPFADASTRIASEADDHSPDYDYGSADWTPTHWPSAPPPLTLRGVVGTTAMLEDQNRDVLLASEGMAIGDVDVVIVERDHVVVRYQGEFHTLLLATDLAESSY